MFKVKRPAIIGMLLILLVFTGYLNYQLTQQALLRASDDYKDYENAQMTNLGTEYTSVSDGDYISIVDSNSSQVNLAEVVTSSNEEMIEAMNTDGNAKMDYFVQYRLSRDKLRAGMVDRLDDIVKNEKTTDDVRTKAQEEIIKLGNVSEKELQIEGLVKSKGFDEALVFMTDNDIKVVVSVNELTEQDVVKILDIVKSETQFQGEAIKIMKKQ